MRKLLALSLLVLIALGGVFATSATSATSIKVGDNWFVRSSKGVPKVTVKKGTTVRWRWVGKDAHNVVAEKGPQEFRSKSMTSGSFKKKMRKRGTYTIVCTIHGPGDQSMKLVVK